MTVRESGEMYLEAILVLAKKSGYVRSIDVSEYLGYSKPSVSRAMGILREGGYILMEKDGAITLTDSGKKLAETIKKNYKVGEIRYSSIGPVVGCHTGPGTIAVVFFGTRSDAK